MIEIFKKISNTKQKIYKKNLKGIFFNYVTKLTHVEVAKNSYHSQGVSYMGSPIPFVIV